jgi:hypothetical protein
MGASENLTDQFIERLIAEAPLPTIEQRDRLAPLLRTAPQRGPSGEPIEKQAIGRLALPATPTKSLPVGPSEADDAA